ncbi:helix-turn-helix domain-containing protein [Actinoplanes sp. NPDC051475]|uniref:helix-turn-helix domain-containing protein n=1 Tax=Actinoplanes sp. NPDC051475 TaxID=3157225 RepID=UPI00344CACBB
MSDTTSGAYDLRTTDFGDFTQQWHALTGGGFPMPAFSPATMTNFRVRFRATRVRDVAITTADGPSAVRTAGGPGRGEDHVRLWLVSRGEWALGDSREDSELTVPAGGFVLRHVGRLSHFATPPHTTAQVFVLPGAALTPLLRGRVVTGSVASAEVRLLVAHAGMVHRTLPALGPAGVEAARDTLVELARAVARHGLDAADPRLAPTLAQAAKDLAARRLTDPGLSPAMLAHELNVSVRTLQRAFAAEEQQVATWIRDRRLDEARAALAGGRWSISEIAARWQFADGSHFTRTFKQRYGRTPAEYARELHQDAPAEPR